MASNKNTKQIDALTSRYSKLNETMGQKVTDLTLGGKEAADKLQLLYSQFNAVADKAGKLTDEFSGLDLIMEDVEKANQKYKDSLIKSANIEGQMIALDKKFLDQKYKKLAEQNKILAIEAQIQAARNNGDKERLDFLKKQLKEENALRSQEAQKRLTSDFGNLFTGGADAKQNLKNDFLKSIGFGAGEDGKAQWDLGILADAAKQLTEQIKEIGAYQKRWDTRLFGDMFDSYSSLVTNVTNIVGASPFLKQSEVMKNIDKAIETGLAYNIEERAFLETLSDSIATTFNAFDSTLLQIVRVQQQDSTAYRLGMEASLNKYLNGMFYNTEYLNGISDSVTSALYEATSLMSAGQSIGFEYQVQKWLGSLYSVGMSSEAINSIAGSLGKLASGDISGTDSGAGKLLVMAASRAGLNYSELLTKGINESQMNKLLESMVTYLEQIANSNKVVQQQYANVFGLKTSDIVAANNLTGSIGAIKLSGALYNPLEAYSNLAYMAQTAGSRMSIAEMISNSTDNFKYTLAGGIAGNPVLYSLWQISNFIDDYMGGIAIPAFAVMGNMVDLETTVADLMQVGALSGSVLRGLGSIVSSLAEAASPLGAAGMLTKMSTLSGVQNVGKTVVRGIGLAAANAIAGPSTSVSNYVGNSSGSDVYDSSMAGADDKKAEIGAQAQEGNTEVKLAEVNDNVIKLYNLFDSLTFGGRLRVISAKDEILG